MAKDNKYRAISLRFKDGRMAETVYNKEQMETAFAEFGGKGVEIVESVRDERGNEIYPMNEGNGLLTTNFVRLPSGIIKYGGPKAMFNDVRDFVRTYVYLPENFSTVVALYILFTWVHDRFRTIPYLRVIGTFGTGKTRFQEVVGNLVYKSMISGGSISTAAMFRLLDEIRGTLILDEADFRNSEMWSDIVKILNAGHSVGFPVVKTQKRGDTFVPQTFHVFGPKILASRERFSDEALESRCLTQWFHPIEDTEKPTHLPDDFDELATKMRNKLLAFRFDAFQKLKIEDSLLDSLKFPRLKQSALSLATVAKMAGDDVLVEFVEFLENYENDLRGNQTWDVKADVLLCVAELMQQESEEKIYIQAIADSFNNKYFEDYSGRRVEYDNVFSRFMGNRVSPKKIGGHVRALGIPTSRDSEGFYISVPETRTIIKSLVGRYGLESKIHNVVKNDETKQDDNF